MINEDSQGSSYLQKSQIPRGVDLDTEKFFFHKALKELSQNPKIEEDFSQVIRFFREEVAGENGIVAAVGNKKDWSFTLDKIDKFFKLYLQEIGESKTVMTLHTWDPSVRKSFLIPFEDSVESICSQILLSLTHLILREGNLENNHSQG
jgi:hypothetical protein